MMNYMKSEFYRCSRSKTVYGFIILFSLVSLLITGILGWSLNLDEIFLYGTTSFAYSIIVGYPMWFVLFGILVATLLYDESRRNGNLKNTVSFGISRVKIFVGMSVVATSIATIAMIVILSVYVLSAHVWLKHMGPVQLTDLYGEVVAMYLIAMAAIVSTLFFLSYFTKGGLSVFLVFAVWIVVPSALHYLTLKIEWLNQLVHLLPNNFFANMQVNLTKSVTAWGTSEGMLKCVLIGLVHLIVAYLFSFILLAKRDI